jgi:ribosomal protein S18 acetylase RimI-like enzyme
MAETSAPAEVRAQRASGPTLRRATTDDIPALVALGRAVVPPTYGPIDAAYAQRMMDEWWTPEVFTRSMQTNHHLVAEVDGAVVAVSSFGRLSRSYRDFPYVDGDREVMWKLYVHPDHHGRGLGTRLLAEVESLVEGDQLWLEVVDGNDQASAFYRSRGFHEVHRVTDGEWPDDIWMMKELSR